MRHIHERGQKDIHAYIMNDLKGRNFYLLPNSYKRDEKNEQEKENGGRRYEYMHAEWERKI